MCVIMLLLKSVRVYLKNRRFVLYTFQHLKISVTKSLLARVATDSLFSDIKY